MEKRFVCRDCKQRAHQTGKIVFPHKVVPNVYGVCRTCAIERMHNAGCFPVWDGDYVKIVADKNSSTGWRWCCQEVETRRSEYFDNLVSGLFPHDTTGHTLEGVGGYNTLTVYHTQEREDAAYQLWLAVRSRFNRLEDRTTSLEELDQFLTDNYHLDVFFAGKPVAKYPTNMRKGLRTRYGGKIIQSESLASITVHETGVGASARGFGSNE